MAKPNGDLILLTLAAAQHGVVTRVQLRERGLADSTITRRSQQGVLERLGQGVFVVAGFQQPETVPMAALLELPHALLSHFSAARLYGLAVSSPRQPQVTVPWGLHHASSLSEVRQSKHLPSYDQTTRGLLRVTTVERTIIDVLPFLTPVRASHLIDVAVARHGASAASFIACFAGLARRGRRGTVARRMLLDNKLAEESVTASVLEARLAALLVDYDIHGFIPQYKPPWFDGVRGVVDFAHPEAKVILEADGRTWHSSHAAMEEDRRRDRRAAAHGWQTLRFMWPEVTRRPATVADDIVRVIANRLAGQRRTA